MNVNIPKKGEGITEEITQPLPNKIGSSNCIWKGRQALDNK
jgi:hypothetical protein